MGGILGLLGQGIVERAIALFTEMSALSDEERIETINSIRCALHLHSPFVNEPVDCVQWLPAAQILANEYNPNVVAPPEMKLLERSIAADGYTQPVVAWQMDPASYEVVDGFHRRRIGTESKAVRLRTRGYLPVTLVNQDRQEYGDRVAATIRHNRARGKHQIAEMSEIVQDLAKRNWSDTKISRELGMDQDEVLRLKQIGGLVELFADQEFSEAWG